MEKLTKKTLLTVIVGCLALTAFSFKNRNASKATSANPVALKKAAAPLAKRADFNFKNIEFDFNHATIRESSFAELDAVAKKLIDTKASLKVSGHADNKGTYLANWKLSQARAESVKKYIVSKGYDESKIAATEFGDTKPIASNNTKLGRQKNRRVELDAY